MVKLEISLKRLQSFIFDVPRLKAMLGANALVGQCMRHELPKLMTGRGKPLVWPKVVALRTGSDPLDPPDGTDQDKPAALYERGILARDGGRFIGVFEDEDAALDFRRDAEACLAEHLPGVRYDIECAPFEKDNTHTLRSDSSPNEIHLMHLPVLQVCQETGGQPASGKWTTPDNETRWISESVKRRREWGDNFAKGHTRDIVGLMRPSLYPAERNWDKPDDIKDLAAGGYLALIHADGNMVGQRFNDCRTKHKNEDCVTCEAHGEAFFHSMRVAVRRSVVSALKATFTQSNGVRPYEVLMLGGDDLLLVCRADKALDFALNYARALQTHELADGRCLHMAIGVAIAKHTYPLHRLHELAESLASSAKRLYRASPDADKQSVIDWQVVTQSWFEDVEVARRRSECIEYVVDKSPDTLLLSARPYRVLCGHGLEHLLNRARDLDRGADDETRAARSALRTLRGACEQGRLSGEMAFSRLPSLARTALGGDLWQKVKGVHVTRALDIIGIYEIARLGRKRHV